MEREVLRWLEDAYYLRDESDNEIARVGPTPHLADAVVTCMTSVCEGKWKTLPVWVQPPPKEEGEWRADRCIAFEDVVVCVEGGKIKTRARDENWLGVSVIPVNWDPNAKCPRWLECLEQWGQGDPNWGALAQRWFGYNLMSHREYRKFMLMEGKTAGGKGTAAHVMKALLGQPGYTSIELETIAGEFGIAGIENANCVWVPEVSRLDGRAGEKVARLIRQLVGGDSISVNEKYERIKRDVDCHAAMTLSSNQIPKLPNQSKGLSAKMLILPITVSFDQKGAEVGLKERLSDTELEGIAAWAVEGARQLESSGQEQRWPVPERAEDIMQKYRIMNNPIDAFLEGYFIKNEYGFVVGPLVRSAWKRFCKRNGGPSLKIPDTQLLIQMEQESTWDIRRDRELIGDHRVRGLRGILLKKDVEDDM